MSNIVVTLNTDDIIESIRRNVNNVIKYYERSPKNELWQIYAKMTYSKFHCLTLVAFKDDSNFTEAYDELAELTDFNKLYKYQEIIRYMTGR